MARKALFTLRVSSDERQILAAIAQCHGLTESDITRWLWRKEARMLGILGAPIEAHAAGEPPEPAATTMDEGR